MKNFWEKSKKPIFLMAPMEDVTDTVFRQLLVDCGRPSVMFTEFTNVDGICSQKGFKHVSQRLVYTEPERPLVAQIWGTNPETFKEAARIIKSLGFDGIDINMGCPERGVVRKGAGGGCIKHPEVAAKLIQAVKEGAPNLPVSVKTRIGLKEIQTEEWTGFLLDQDIAALTVHLRTVREMSNPPAHWDEIEKVVKLRNKKKCDTLIFGNGDINSLEEAKQKVEKYKIDGVMIATGIFHNPWMFNENIAPLKVPIQDRFNLLRHHVDIWDKTWGNTKNFQALKKYFKIYIQGFDGASDYRVELMKANSPKETYDTLARLKKKLDNKQH